jgi:hypothetical protein
MATKIKIEICTNRIYFESFETPCGRLEKAELETAWESAIYDTIEAAGFEAKTTIGGGFDPARDYGIAVNGVFCAWLKLAFTPDLKKEIKKIAETITDDCSGDDCDCLERAEEFVAGVLPSILRDARRVAEAALEAGEAAAQKLSDEFVKSSEETN